MVYAAIVSLGMPESDVGAVEGLARNTYPIAVARFFSYCSSPIFSLCGFAALLSRILRPKRFVVRFPELRFLAHSFSYGLTVARGA